MLHPCFRRWLLWLLLCPFTTAQANESLSASDRLEQARQKLVNQVMQAGALVDAISWLDASGRLHEHQSLRQSIEWLTPLETPRPTVRDVLSERLASGAESACPPSTTGPALFTPLGLSAQWPERLHASMRERLQQVIRTQWMGVDDRGRNWRMFQIPATSWPSTYQQRLLAPALPLSDWQVKLQLELLPTGSATHDRLQMRLALSQPQGEMAEQQVQLDLQVQPQAWGPALWTEVSWQRIESQLAAWADLLDHHTACARPQPLLQSTPTGGWRLNMGRLAGMHVGDEWAIVDPAWLPQRALEPGAIGKMVVARVVQVDDNSAEVMPVAGDTQQLRAGWSAHPLSVRAARTLNRPGQQQVRR